MNKEKFKLVFLFLPLALVLYIFISNLILSLTASEVKFKTQAYDPYDIIRGKYLSVQIETENEYIIKDIQGVVPNDKSYEGTFIKTYKSLEGERKERFEQIVNELVSLSRFYESHDTDWYNYKDESNFYNLSLELNSFNEELDEDYELRTLLDKITLCEKQNENYFELISNIDFKEVDPEEARKHYEKLRKNSIYLYYEIDEDGFANITNVSYKKLKDNDNYIKEDSNISTWENDWIKITRITGSEKEFFIDERLASVAEDAIFDARDNGKDVVIVCKNVKGRMQIKQMLIDNIDLFEYLENYSK